MASSEPAAEPVAVESAAASVVSLTCGMCVVGAWWVWMVVRSSSAWSVCLCAPACPVSGVPCVSRLPRCLYTGKHSPGGAGTHTGHTRDTRKHKGKGTRTAQTNLTTIQTHQQHPTRTSARRPKPNRSRGRLGVPVLYCSTVRNDFPRAFANLHTSLIPLKFIQRGYIQSSYSRSPPSPIKKALC